MKKDMSRRSFIKTGTTAAIGLSMMPGTVFGSSKDSKKKKTVKTEKLKILGVGIGGRGAAVLRELETEDIIGLCDVDWKYAQHVFERYPKAKRYNDYKKMFAEMLDECGGVCNSRPYSRHHLRRSNSSRQARVLRKTAHSHRL